MRFFIVALFILIVSRASALLVDVQPGERECFILPLTEGTPFSGNFELLSPSKVGPFEVKVLSPEATGHKVEYSASGETKGTLSMDADASGDYLLCLENGNDDEHDNLVRRIGFNFRAGLPSDLAMEASIQKPSGLIEMVNELVCVYVFF